VTDKFLKKFSEFAAKELGKPESLIMVDYTLNPRLMFGGVLTKPCFLLHIASLGNITPETNEIYSKAFSEFLTQELGIDYDSGYIIFNDPGKANYGYKSTTFESIPVP